MNKICCISILCKITKITGKGKGFNKYYDTWIPLMDSFFDENGMLEKWMPIF
jgi:hypothetical protein